MHYLRFLSNITATTATTINTTATPITVNISFVNSNVEAEGVALVVVVAVGVPEGAAETVGVEVADGFAEA